MWICSGDRGVPNCIRSAERPKLKLALCRRADLRLCADFVEKSRRGAGIFGVLQSHRGTGTGPMDRLKNKAALVIGGATGIGLAIAKRFSQEGAEVIVTGRREAELRQAAQTDGARAGLVRSEAVPGG